MELHGEVAIPASRERVWAALNDPAVLARCIDGVETLQRIEGDAGGDPRFEGKMHAKVGPVRATFAGQVTLTQVQPPASYVLVGEGKGGVAGFAKGEAAVTLTEQGPDATLLAYTVTSSVGGKLAQLGARLIEGTAKAYAETFFARLAAEVSVPAVSVDAITGAAVAGGADTAIATSASPLPLPMPRGDAVATPAGGVATGGGGLPSWLWAVIVIAAVLAFLAWQLR